MVEKRQYKLKAAVEDEEGAREIVAKILEQPMGVTIRELLGMSKSARELIKNEITAKRVPIVEVKKTSIEDVPNEDDQLSRTKQTLPRVRVLVSTFLIGRMPSGSTYVSDPIEQFLVEGGDQGDLAKIVVAKESQSLRAIYPTIMG